MSTLTRAKMTQAQKLQADFADEIAGDRKELARREALLALFPQALAAQDLRTIAEVLHGFLCHDDHGDHCSWEWENDPRDKGWEGEAHQEWLREARLLLRGKADL